MGLLGLNGEPKPTSVTVNKKPRKHRTFGLSPFFPLRRCQTGWNLQPRSQQLHSSSLGTQRYNGKNGPFLPWLQQRCVFVRKREGVPGVLGGPGGGYVVGLGPDGAAALTPS
jgi:hypothetical protein